MSTHPALHRGTRVVITAALGYQGRLGTLAKTEPTEGRTVYGYPIPLYSVALDGIATPLTFARDEFAPVPRGATP
ncbi:MAG: hypothetical protein V4739_04705 [Pseudomonadota bacterium]